MKNRIDIVRRYADDILNRYPSPEESRIAYLHTYSVASLCSMIAGRRGLDGEIAFIIGLLHDMYSYRTGIHPLHSHNGAEMARPALRDMAIFNAEEMTVILSAIFHHADKHHIHDAYDELIKDADHLQHCLVMPSFPLSEPGEMKRLENLVREFGLNLQPAEHRLVPKPVSVEPGRKTRMAKTAETLARKNIRGERNDTDFLSIIRYFPEAAAFDELKSAWCAAFVYHCCRESGFTLPIRPPHTSCRLAAVAAWLEWGTDNGFCFYPKDGFVPAAGDIIIYNDILPKDYKPADSPWCDHIGIVLSSEGSKLTVAEGNTDNRNCSGITERVLDDSIGCFLRIPDDYIYDGWKYDYKTGKERVVEY
jgi:hypothetical protein